MASVIPPVAPNESVQRIIVEGIQDYLDDGGDAEASIPLITLSTPDIDFSANFVGGDVDGGLGSVTVTDSGAELEITGGGGSSTPGTLIYGK